MKLTLLVLAAGMGSRYGGLKQIDPVGPNGEFIIDYSIYDAIQAGISRVVFVIRREMEPLFREAVGDRFQDRIEVDYAFQELDMLPEGYSLPETRAKPWGTAHATLVAKDAVPGPVVVINADDFYGRTAYQALADFLRRHPDPAKNEYALAGFRLSQTVSPHGSVSRGICEVDSSGHLQSVTERTRIGKSENGVGFEFHEGNRAFPLTGNEIASMNMWAFTPTIFHHLERLFRSFLDESRQNEKAEFFLPTAVDRLIHEGTANVSVLTTADRWFGVTYPEDKQEVTSGIQELIAKGQYPENLWSG